MEVCTKKTWLTVRPVYLNFFIQKYKLEFKFSIHKSVGNLLFSHSPYESFIFFSLGKSFLLGKLRDEMKNFTKEWIIEPTFENSPLIFVLILHMALVFGMVSWLLSYLAINLGAHASIVAVGIAFAIIFLTYLFLFGIMKFSRISHHANIYVRAHHMFSRIL